MLQNPRRLLLIIWFGLMAVAAANISNTQWQSSVLSFLPASNESNQNDLLHQNPANQQIRLLLHEGDIQAYQAFAHTLMEQELPIHWLNPLDESKLILDRYREFSGLLVSDEDLGNLLTGEFEGLVTNAWRHLNSPVPMAATSLAQDPLALTESYLEQSRSISAEPHQYGFTLSDEPLTWLILGNIQHDGFDRSAASELVTAVAQATTRMQASNVAARVARSGVPFHTSEAAERAEWEMNTFGIISLVGVMSLLWFTFRSLTPIRLALSVLTVALSTGFAFVVLFYNQVHLIALVFSTALVGIAVDYAIHGMVAAGGGRQKFRRMLPHLRLGVLTTLLGYAALWLLPFPLLKQVAVFISSGLIAAYLTVHFGFRHSADKAALEIRTQVELVAEKYQAFWQRLRPKYARTLVFVLGGISLVMVSTLQFDDQVSRLSQSSNALIAAEARVQQSTNPGNTESHWLIQEAADIETLLQEQEQFRAGLQNDGKILNWQMLADQLPSTQRQQASQEALATLWESTLGRNYLSELGLEVPELHKRWLQLNDLSEWQQLLVQKHNNTLVTFLQLQTESNWQPSQLNLPINMKWFTPLDDASKAIGKLREQLYFWVGLALAISFVMLLVLRGLLVAACGVSYLLFVLVTALRLSQYIDGSLHIFHLVAVILVLGLAIDYLVFFSAPLRASSMQLAVKLSAATSMIAFGLLSFSSTPAIASFGLTILFGILIAAVAAPLFSRLKVGSHECY